MRNATKRWVWIQSNNNCHGRVVILQTATKFFLRHVFSFQRNVTKVACISNSHVTQCNAMNYSCQVTKSLCVASANATLQSFGTSMWHYTQSFPYMQSLWFQMKKNHAMLYRIHLRHSFFPTEGNGDSKIWSVYPVTK